MKNSQDVSARDRVEWSRPSQKAEASMEPEVTAGRGGTSWLSDLGNLSRRHRVGPSMGHCALFRDDLVTDADVRLVPILSGILSSEGAPEGRKLVYRLVSEMLREPGHGETTDPAAAVPNSGRAGRPAAPRRATLSN